MAQLSQDVAYAKESEIISQFRSVAAREDLTREATAEALNSLCAQYERLLDDSKLLTSVGDRLQRKLKGANLMLREQADEIKRINGTLQDKNTQLLETIDELTRTKASRRAQAVTFSITVLLFFISEFLEDYFAKLASSSEYAAWISWGSKIALLLMFKPLEGLTESYMVRQAKRKKEQEQALLLTQQGKEAAPVKA